MKPGARPWPDDPWGAELLPLPMFGQWRPFGGPPWNRGAAPWPGCRLGVPGAGVLCVVLVSCVPVVGVVAAFGVECDDDAASASAAPPPTSAPVIAIVVSIGLIRIGCSPLPWGHKGGSTPNV
jgi:hypothetical protein